MTQWGGQGTEGGPWASFFARYQRPLSSYARRRFGVDADLAEELAARFVARELAREQRGERPIFRLYNPAAGRFRSLLATSFWRFARDELQKESRRKGVSLDAYPDLGREVEADDEFCKLVAREFFNVVRETIRKDLDSDDARTVLDLKWPVDPSADPLSNTEVERETGLSRSKVRTLTKRVGEAFLKALKRYATDAGLSPGEIHPFLADTCAVLDRE